MMVAKYGADPERPWSADMIGRGVPHVIATFRYNRERLNPPPRLRFQVRGIRVHDPRKDSTVGGGWWRI